MKLNTLLKNTALKIRRVAIVSALTGPFLLLALASTLHAQSSGDEIAALRPNPSNGDYLNHVEAPTTEMTFYSGMFSKLTKEMSQRYNSFYQIYDERRKYGLNEMGDEIRFSDANKDMMRWTLRRLLQENVTNPARRFAWGQIKNEFRQFGDDSDDNREKRSKHAQKESAGALSGVKKKPIDIANHESKDFFQTLTYFYNSGIPLNDDARLHFHYDVPAGLMDMVLTNPIIEPTVGYALMPLDFNLANGLRTSSNKERVLVSLRKTLGEIGLSSGVHYELVTQSLNYGISKHLIGPLDAAIDQSHYATASWRNETTATLNMSAGF